MSAGGPAFPNPVQLFSSRLLPPPFLVLNNAGSGTYPLVPNE